MRFARLTTRTTGVLAVIGASLMWAVEPIFAKLAYAGSDYLQTSAVRAVGVTLTALAYVALTNRANLKITGRQFSVLLYIAFVGTLVADLLYLLALERIPVLNAVLIGHMQPISVVLIGYFVLKQDRLTRYDYLGIAVMIAAALLVTTKTLENLTALKFGTSGDLLVALATVAWATTGIAMRKYLTELNAGVITFYRFLIASLVFTAYLSFGPGLRVSNIHQVLIGLSVGLGTILYYEGLKRLKAAQVSALELSTPFFALLLDFLIRGQTVTLLQVIGVLLLFAGVYMLSRKEETYF